MFQAILTIMQGDLANDVANLKNYMIIIMQDRIQQVLADIAYISSLSADIVFLPDGSTIGKQVWIDNQNAEIAVWQGYISSLQ